MSDTAEIAGRTFTMAIDIDASPEDVWRALTEADELVRWFPLQARVTPGVGGKVSWSWGENWAGESKIAAWEPCRRLLLAEERTAYDASGQPLPGPLQRMAMEFTIETSVGRTRLRLVHSGFGLGADWNDELDSTSAGWQHELRGLRHYLQRHKGRNRHCAFTHRITALSAADVWRRMLSPAGFTVTAGSLTEGSTCSMQGSTGDRFDGVVQLHAPEWDLAITVKDLDDGILRLSTWKAGGQTGVQIWLNTWNAHHAGSVRDFGGRADALLNRLLA